MSDIHLDQAAVHLAKTDDAALVLQAVPGLVWTAQAAGVFTWSNDRLREYGGAALSVEGWLGLVHPDDRAQTLASWSTAVSTGRAYEAEVRLRRADGAFRWHLARASALQAADGSVACWVGSCTDIEKQKATAEALRRDNEQLEQDIFNHLHEVKRTQTRLQAYFDACPEYLTLMLLSKINGLTYEDLNPAAVTFEGRPRAAIVGRSPIEIVGPEVAADIELHVRHCLKTGKTIDYLSERRSSEGTPIYIQVVGAPLEFFNEEEGLVLFCGRDITQQRGTEEALRQSQKMEAVGQLTGGLAHDFNNLLTGITGSLDLLQMRIAKGRLDSVDRYVTAAQSAASRAASLTHRLLAFSRRQTLDPKPTDINQLVRDMEDLVKRTVGPEIVVDVATGEDIWTILVDPSQLENALLNLCINARDAMPDHSGQIIIRTENTRLDERDAVEQDLSPGDYVVLSVTDDGAGMSPDVVKRIFDPFFTTKPIGMGTGLGLSMIYGFARQSGGQVRVQSKVGAGTTMRILLPRHFGRAENTTVALGELAAAPRSAAGETVLVVDDEPTVRMLVTEVLEDLGYSALEAVDGPTGVKLLQSPARIDLLVTDVGLPGGMNGRQLAEAGRALRPELKILFITGYAENAVLNHGHLEPGMQVLTKPFAMEALASRIKSLFDEETP